MIDIECIALVKALRHRTDGGRHNCPCEECKAIKRVCGLALEALAMKTARKRDTPRTTEML